MKGHSLRAYDPVNKKKFSNETSVELHISIETEDVDNKDILQNYTFPVMTGYSFDMTIEQQIPSFRVGNKYTLIPGDLHDNISHIIALEKFNGKGSTAKNQEVCYGTFYTQSVSYKADNRKVVTSTLKLQGTGALTIGNYTSTLALNADETE